MPHAETIACVKKAESLLKMGDIDSLRYASLQLRMGIEYLFYELLPLYREELPEEIFTKVWQPKRILDAILKCDPDADEDGAFAVAPTGTGVDEPGWMHFKSKAPNKHLLDQHYQRLGSYLHAPVNLVAPNINKWKTVLDNCVADLQKFTPDQILENIRIPVVHTCICGKKITRNKDGVKKTGVVQCHNSDCNAVFDVRFEGDETVFTLQSSSYNCPYCSTENFVAQSLIRDGQVFKCVECHKRVVSRATFQLEAVDEIQDILEAAKAGHISDAQHLQFYAHIGNEIAKKVNDALKPSPTEKAMSMLMGRLVQSGNTMRELFDHASNHNWSWDGVSILRTSFDAMLQAMYILYDPAKSDERATRFLDFRIVEQVKLLKIIKKGSTTFSRRMVANPRLAEVEPQIMAEFDRICKKYELDPEERRHRDWYNAKLDKLATDTAYFTEYEIAQKQFSGVVHSSAFGLENEFLTPFNVARIQWEFAFRVLGRYSSIVGVKLSETEQKLVEEGTRCIYDNPALEPETK